MLPVSVVSVSNIGDAKTPTGIKIPEIKIETTSTVVTSEGLDIMMLPPL